MAEAAQLMDDTPEILTPARFGTPDLADKGIYVKNRLREKYPHLSDRFLLGWLGGLTGKNEYFFIHTKNAALLAERGSDVLSPAPTVRLIFNLARNPKDKDHIEEAANLYEHLMRWAFDVGALKVIDLDRLSDVPKPAIQARLGSRLLVEETIWAKPQQK